MLLNIFIGNTDDHALNHLFGWDGQALSLLPAFDLEPQLDANVLRSQEMIDRVFQGKKEGLTRDDVLDNITITWLTNTGVSSGRLYWENTLGFFDVSGFTKLGCMMPRCCLAYSR